MIITLIGIALLIIAIIGFSMLDKLNLYNSKECSIDFFLLAMPC